MNPLEKACEEIRQVSDERQAERDASRAFDEKVERVAMHMLGKTEDPAPGIDWWCGRTWTVGDVRKLVREALEQEAAR